MAQLIAYRAVQGLGAGAVIPLSMTIIGELYTLEERARTQALFSGMWGVASIAGPLVGGYITDTLSWRWVFYLNLPFGLLATLVIAAAYPAAARPAAPRVDWLGAALLFGGVTTLLIALGGTVRSTAPWAAVTLAQFVLLVIVERRHADPILPLDLFGHAVVSRSLIVVFMTGMAMFGAIAFVPLFVQGVGGGTATEAGQVLTPLFLGWVSMSIIAARLTVLIGYRPVAIAGNALLMSAFIVLARVDAETTRTLLFVAVFILGSGMGLSMLALLLAVQHGVDRSLLGTATSLNQFSRSVGATVGVAIMGAILARGLTGLPIPVGPTGITSGVIQLEGAARMQFAHALGRVFAAGGLMAAIALLSSLVLPPVDFSKGVPAGSGERMLAAEMANLESDGEPHCVLGDDVPGSRFPTDHPLS
jgi:MFS family permease